MNPNTEKKGLAPSIHQKKLQRHMTVRLSKCAPRGLYSTSLSTLTPDCMWIPSLRTANRRRERKDESEIRNCAELDDF
ncbi:hypothetical protein SUGI_0583140 [Cryptomeria japonica]|nr:hypothetical protein SUGI_0583140 [Cryptomeria japonica]